MADLPSGARPAGSTNGTNGRPQGRKALAGSDQTASEGDQTRSDGDQTLSDSDQTLSDSDQTNADRDQLASDSDQAASDRDLGAGVDPRAHEYSHAVRENTTRDREQIAGLRVEGADRRDAIADDRDVAGAARDAAADERDRAMAAHDAVISHEDAVRSLTGAEIVRRAAGQRRRAADHRALAAEQRRLAADDRRAAAADREEAARERRRALVDREALARRVALADADPLTGARTRAAGLADLDRELNRCQRTGSPLVVVFIDVVGLKLVNDTKGHAAGDDLLVRVVASMKNRLRSYDLIVRYGGDEFLCAMSETSLAQARKRFSAIADALAAAPEAGQIRSGFAELAGDETTTQLIARADHELVAGRAARPRAGA